MHDSHFTHGIGNNMRAKVYFSLSKGGNSIMMEENYLRNEGIAMLCGSKCFLVEMERNGTKEMKEVKARHVIGARKVVKGEYGAEVEILSIREKNSRK